METNSILTYGVLIFLSIGLFFAASVIVLAGVVLYAATYFSRRVFYTPKQVFPTVAHS